MKQILETGFKKEVEKIDSVIYKLEKKIETLRTNLFTYELDFKT